MAVLEARLERIEQAESRFDSVYSRLDNVVTVAHMNEMRTSIENRLNTLTTVGVGILVGMLMVVIGAVASGILN